MLTQPNDHSRTLVEVADLDGTPAHPLVDAIEQVSKPLDHERR